jgi:hypothetical protein
VLQGRLTRIETLIGDGLIDNVRHIKENCPLCLTGGKFLGRMDRIDTLLSEQHAIMKSLADRLLKQEEKD